ncbi:hypothetical protein EVB64_110 [Rhizobium phage RHph_TM61]|nr:hypothetical protein EVB64_110 [Rhizobium phage RHph_TM61]
MSMAVSLYRAKFSSKFAGSGEFPIYALNLKDAEDRAEKIFFLMNVKVDGDTFTSEVALVEF